MDVPYKIKREPAGIGQYEYTLINTCEDDRRISRMYSRDPIKAPYVMRDLCARLNTSAVLD